MVVGRWMCGFLVVRTVLAKVMPYVNINMPVMATVRVKLCISWLHVWMKGVDKRLDFLFGQFTVVAVKPVVCLGGSALRTAVCASRVDWRWLASGVQCGLFPAVVVVVVVVEVDR